MYILYYICKLDVRIHIYLVCLQATFDTGLDSACVGAENCTRCALFSFHFGLRCTSALEMKIQLNQCKLQCNTKVSLFLEKLVHPVLHFCYAN